MVKLSPSQQIAEITVRVIVAALQVLAIVGGILMLVLYPDDVTDNSTTADDIVGGLMIAVGSLILIYEIFMIVFAATNFEGVHHSVRLTVDIVLKVIFAILTILATLGLFVLAVILFIVLFAIGSVVVAVFAVPLVLGVLYSITFIVSAVVSGVILAKLNTSRTPQPTQVIMAPPQAVVFVPQQPVVGYGQPPNQLQYNPPPPGYKDTSMSPAVNYPGAYPQTGYAQQPAVQDPQSIPEKH